MNRFVFEKDGLEVTVTAYSEKTFRVSYGKKQEPSLIVTAKPSAIDCSFDESDDEKTISTKEAELRVRKSDLSVRLFGGGKLLSTVSAPEFEEYEIFRFKGGEARNRKTVDGEKTTVVGGRREIERLSRHARLIFSVSDELLFGLGSHEEGFPCVNGNFVPLFQENMRIAVPRFVSDKGYAVLIDNTSFMTFDCREEGSGKLFIDCADCVDYYLSVGDFGAVSREYRFLTGVTPMLPKASLGYFQSKCEYKNQDELLAVVKRYRELGVPLDFIVQDWQYWEDDCWGDKNLDLRRFPDMSGCINELHQRGAKIMISVWPHLGGKSRNRKEFVEKGMLIGDTNVYNAFDEEARKCFWRQADEGLFRNGIDAWWCDCSEPFEVGWSGEKRAPFEVGMEKTVLEFKKYVDDSLLNAFSLFHSKGMFENQRASSTKRVLNMTRSGYAGQHRYGTVVWSGDISASWETLKRQVHIVQNYTATGEAFWNSDVGAFFHDTADQWFWKGKYDDGCSDERYRELYARWMQFAGFTSVMRSHGMHSPKEIWEFGKPGEPYYEAIRAAIELRYRLMPYLYSVNAAVTFEGEMPLKPLALAFPDDEKAKTVFDEFLYGDELLICPVTEPGIERMKVYLPKGEWFDFFGFERFEGGKEHEIGVTLDRIPVFAKAGAIVPTVRVMNYVDEIPDAEYKVLVFPKADGEFLLYDDNGENYDYEKGEFSRIKITFDNSTGEIKTEQLGKEKYAHLLRFEVIGT